MRLLSVVMMGVTTHSEIRSNGIPHSFQVFSLWISYFMTAKDKFDRTRQITGVGASEVSERIVLHILAT